MYYHLGKQEAVAYCVNDGVVAPYLICEYITLFSSNVHFLPMGIIKSQYYGHRHNPNCNPRCSPIDVVISDGVWTLMDVADQM